MNKSFLSLISSAAGAGLLALSPTVVQAQTDLEGRWEGLAQIPGAAMPIVLDLSRRGNASGPVAVWLTLPGRGIKGLALPAAQTAADGSLRIDATPAFGAMGPPKPAPELVLTLDGNRLRGQFLQAGHQAPLLLERTGAAQPEAVLANSTLTPLLTGVWRGGYTIGGLDRQVTLTLTPSSADAVIVGRRTVSVPFDGIRLGQHLLTLTSSGTSITIEGRWRGDSGEFEGLFTQGPYEAVITLRKEGRP